MEQEAADACRHEHASELWDSGVGDLIQGKNRGSGAGDLNQGGGGKEQEAANTCRQKSISDLQGSEASDLNKRGKWEQDPAAVWAESHPAKRERPGLRIMIEAVDFHASDKSYGRAFRSPTSLIVLAWMLIRTLLAEAV
eukprot:1157087-Pelagomonas_calceolata.AAC.2